MTVDDIPNDVRCEECQTDDRNYALSRSVLPLGDLLNRGALLEIVQPGMAKGQVVYQQLVDDWRLIAQDHPGFDTAFAQHEAVVQDQGVPIDPCDRYLETGCQGRCGQTNA